LTLSLLLAMHIILASPRTLALPLALLLLHPIQLTVR